MLDYILLNSRIASQVRTRRIVQMHTDVPQLREDAR
jgi:hypothetical protein